MSSLEDHIPVQRGIKLGSQRPHINMAQREAEVAAENTERAAKVAAIATEHENDRAHKEVQETMEQNEWDEKEKRVHLNWAAMDTLTTTKGASQVLKSITKVEVSAGGGGFDTFHAFMDTFFTSNNPDISHWVTNHCRQNGAVLIWLINDKAPEAALNGSLTMLKSYLEQEGIAIKRVLLQGNQKSLTVMLLEFSMENLTTELCEVAPVFWSCLGSTVDSQE